MNGPVYRQQPRTVSQGSAPIYGGKVEVRAFDCFML
jgi:hypothetical protein